MKINKSKYFLIAAFCLIIPLSAEIQCMEDRESYMSCTHTHVSEKQTHDKIKALYIDRDTKLRIGAHSFPIVSNDDEGLIKVINAAGTNNPNHLLMSFEVIYGIKDGIERATFSLCYSPTETNEKFKVLSNLNNISYKDAITPSTGIADFYNKSNFYSTPEFLSPGYNLAGKNVFYINQKKKGDIDSKLGGKSSICAGVKCTPNNDRDGKPDETGSSMVHSEGNVLYHLYQHDYIFDRLIEEVKKITDISNVQTCIMKFYSTQDICEKCQKVLRIHKHVIQDLFDQRAETTNIPVIFVAFGRNTPNLYWFKKDNSCLQEKPFYGNNCFKDEINIQDFYAHNYLLIYIGV
ncbi:MAG: hypothetical protein BGO67_07125 [Alphaproteobacteria bacterium 41-28]|nr:MAG: hypothetical protein BGO67_07125 [Alphaproteobacteria bacterium 41-28]